MPIDTQLQQLLEMMPDLRIAELGPSGMRDAFAQAMAAMPPAPALPKVADRTIADGIGVRIYWPTPDPKDLPVVVHYHGGGFVVGDLDTYGGVCRTIALQTGAIVVAVNYRLAPEHPFPAAVDDSYAALNWVAEHAEELGADPARLAVCGDSAGGNLAAVVAQLAQQAGGPTIVFQLLWYPATTFDLTLPSVVENTDDPVLTLEDMSEYLRLYLGPTPPDPMPATLAPATAASLSGLPPAYIATAGNDPLRDDGTRYAELLKDAGVPVELHEAETLVHGYTLFADVVPAASDALATALAALKSAL
ncbi:alpha/beta hydrolase [Pseudonocardia spinosispora]|uniref:alpha/beta hydrolase n=1 Tax=Pseudonocardia spinosispora TaxID=103441 RepID=UPI0004134F63|nr:alpha/beta hydrolase [Pseudonocardia spinosispora]